MSSSRKVRAVLIFCACLAVIGAAGCDSRGRFLIPGEELFGESLINRWLEDIQDGNPIEVCSKMTDRFRSEALRQLRSCERFVSNWVEYGLPSSVAVVGSEQLGGGSDPKKGSYRFETDSDVSFVIKEGEIDGVLIPTG